MKVSNFLITSFLSRRGGVLEQRRAVFVVDGSRSNCLLHLVLLFWDEEVLFVAVDDHMEGVVNDEEEGGPRHHVRVHFVVSARRLEAGDEGHHNDKGVQAVHRDEVELGAFAQGPALDVGQVAQNEPEANKVEVVGCQDQHEEDWNDLDCQVHCQKCEQLSPEESQPSAR